MDLLTRFTNYLKSPQNKLSKKTVKNYRADLNSFFNWYKKQYNFELSLDPSLVTSQIIKSYEKSKIEDSNLSATSVKRHTSTLKKFFQFLKIERIIPEDPFEQLKTLEKNNLASNDKYHLSAFKNYLYFHNKSTLTIKNYILDVRHFLTWTEEVTNGKNVFSKINITLINEYKERLLEHQFSPRSINRKLSSIRQYLKSGDIEQPIPKSAESRYSRFPPFRLAQKTLRGIDFLFKISLIIPLLKLSSGFKKTKTSPHSEISSLPKSLYAPLSISTRDFSLHEKVWHHIRHNRPHWYKKYHSLSITHYFHLVILILFISQLIFLINQSISPKPQNQPSVLGTLESFSPRILSFAGKLTDSSDNPIIDAETPVRMSIYNDEVASGSSLLWQEVVDISTDSEGKFSTSLGSKAPIPQSLFGENNALWLGVSVGTSSELIPREPIAGVTLANNTEKLQGLTPITSPHADTKNVILALDSSGNLTIDGDANPTFQATGGSFKLLGKTLVLSTAPGTDSNVEIAPMDLGKVDIQKPIFNSTNNNNIDMAIGAVEINDSLAILATTSATSAFVINQNSTGKLISAYATSSAKFAVDNNGDILSQAGSKWQPFSNSTTALNIANAAGNAFVTFDTTNSRIGIGTTAPVLRLDIQDSQSATATAQIFNSNTGSDADGLIVKLGNTSPTSVANSNHFISFETAGIGIVGSVGGSEGMGIDFKTIGIADFAEYLKKDENQDIEYGSVVCIDESGLVLPCNQINNKIVGIASNHGGFTGGNDLGKASIRVGFIGQVYTKVSNMNGDIKPGDSLTSSSIPGIAVKATRTGPIIGKALESSEQCSNLAIEQCKILVALSLSWYDPTIYISKIENPSDDTIISPIAEIDRVHGSIVSPITKNPISRRFNRPLLDNEGASAMEIATDSAASELVATAFDSDPDLTITESLEIASLSGTLDANASSSAIIHDSTLRLPASQRGERSGQEFMIQNSNFEGLMSLAPTSLADTSITGQLSIGTSSNAAGGLILQENSINTIGAVLELQPLRQGALSLMGSLVYIDTNGDLKVDGNAHFAKDVKIDGDLIASGSATFSKLNLKLAKNAFALSSKEIIATGSAGTAFVRAREAEITINNNLVTDKSLIYITPAGTPSGQTPFILRQQPENSFTVGIASPSAKSTPFNWLIIN